MTSTSFFPEPRPVRGMLFTLPDKVSAPKGAIAPIGAFRNMATSGSNYWVDAIFIPRSH